VNACKDAQQYAQLERVFSSSSKRPRPDSQSLGVNAQSRLGIILRSIEDEEWVKNLLDWHKPQKVEVCLLPKDEESVYAPPPSSSARYPALPPARGDSERGGRADPDHELLLVGSRAEGRSAAGHP
jgi:hypothetical protein